MSDVDPGRDADPDGFRYGHRGLDGAPATGGDGTLPGSTAQEFGTSPSQRAESKPRERPRQVMLVLSGAVLGGLLVVGAVAVTAARNGSEDAGAAQASPDVLAGDRTSEAGDGTATSPNESPAVTGGAEDASTPIDRCAGRLEQLLSDSTVYRRSADASFGMTISGLDAWFVTGYWKDHTQLLWTFKCSIEPSGNILSIWTSNRGYLDLDPPTADELAEKAAQDAADEAHNQALLAMDQTMESLGYAAENCRYNSETNSYPATYADFTQCEAFDTGFIEFSSVCWKPAADRLIFVVAFAEPGYFGFYDSAAHNGYGQVMEQAQAPAC